MDGLTIHLNFRQISSLTCTIYHKTNDISFYINSDKDVETSFWTTVPMEWNSDCQAKISLKVGHVKLKRGDLGRDKWLTLLIKGSVCQMKCQSLRVLFVGLRNAVEGSCVVRFRRMANDETKKYVRKYEIHKPWINRGRELVERGRPRSPPPDGVRVQPSSPNPTKVSIPVFTPVISMAAIHSDGVREQVFAPLVFSIKSQALEEEMRNNFAIFGEHKCGKMAS